MTVQPTNNLTDLGIKPTGSWAVYAVQMTLPIVSSIPFGSKYGGNHDYLILVDPDGNVIQELQGVFTTEFTINKTVPGDFLTEQMWGPGQYAAFDKYQPGDRYWYGGIATGYGRHGGYSDG